MSYPALHLRFRSFAAVSIAVVGLVAAGCSGNGESAPTSTAVHPAIESGLFSVADFDEYIDDNPDVPLINVHVPYEGHIAGTDAFIAFDSIRDSDDLPADRSAPIALYCRSGNMSTQAAANLVDAGYANVVDLEGGMNAWTADGRILLNDPTAAEA